MCCWLMKMLGTVRWLVISWRASWMAGPSSILSPTSVSVSDSNPRLLATLDISVYIWSWQPKRTNFVEFHDEELSSLGVQQSLGLVAVRAVGLGEDNYSTPDVSFCASLVPCFHAFKSLDSPTPFSLMIFSALTLAADMAAGEVATEPKRRRNMEAMVGNFLIAEGRRRGRRRRRPGGVAGR